MPPEPDFPTDLQVLEHDYELIRELGQGGMAAVYLARRRDTGELVAIKAIRARYLDDPDALQRFAREARTVADLDHPNIVHTEAIEQIGDRAVAIIMEYFEGGTVRDRLREYGPFSAEEAEAVLRDVANALGYAHRRGIVHRDVKPENIFLHREGARALLSDFGIARRIEGDVPITLLGAALGTPQYMSPEQIDGGVVDGRSDIYSLGVVGWELLTGRRPWSGENLYGIIYKQKHEELPRITALRPRVPANLLFAIEGALAKDREHRWHSVDEFLAHLTYSPPPVLAQSFPASATRADDAPTVRFPRASTHAPAAPDRTLERVARGHVPLERSAREQVSRARFAGAGAAARSGGEKNVPETPDAARHVAMKRTTVRDTSRRGMRGMRPLMLALGLLVPLAIAATSWYVLLGGRPEDSSRGAPSEVVMSSGGTVAFDSASPDTVVARRTSPAGSADSARVSVPIARRDSEPEGRRAEPKREPPAPPPASRPTSPAARPAVTREAPVGSGPSPRCRVATMADQRACLLAHIAANDAVLQRVYDSLIVELRRIAGTRRGEADPPSVTRLRVEQRAWIGVRDEECTRQPAPGSVPLWAEPLSECFAAMSAARADELGEALQRVRAAR